MFKENACDTTGICFATCLWGWAWSTMCSAPLWCPFCTGKEHAGTYRKALPSGSWGQAGIEKPGADCLKWAGRRKRSGKRGWYGKRPQDAVLEKAEVALGQICLSRDDFRLFIKVLRTFSVPSSYSKLSPSRPQVSGPVFLLMTAGKEPEGRKPYECVSCVFAGTKRAQKKEEHEIRTPLTRYHLT